MCSYLQNVKTYVSNAKRKRPKVKTIIIIMIMFRTLIDGQKPAVCGQFRITAGFSL